MAKEVPQRTASRQKRRRGQGLTETILVVALVAIGCIGVVGLFGDNIRGLFGTSADAVAGNTAAVNTDHDSSAIVKEKTLVNFGDNTGQGGGGGGGNRPTR